MGGARIAAVLVVLGRAALLVAGFPTRTEAAEVGGCRSGMVAVDGEYCPSEHVEQTCLRWLSSESERLIRCAEFAPTDATKCSGRSVHKRFCIDRFEYPNREGELPTVMRSFLEAEQACKAEDKRLCKDSEWTLACEGADHLPYPYGLIRDANACNIDREYAAPDEHALASSNATIRDAEVERLYQGEASGSRAACVSPYGAVDMTGNVDEWVVNESGEPYKSGLKGGYWGPVRDRCRPMTLGHAPEFRFYQIGFRCCSSRGAELLSHS